MQMMNYKMDELLTIVAELTEKYTAKESTSISYEQARQLMEAVLYCINQCGENNPLVSSKGIAAKEVYRRGYEKLIQKVKKTQITYNEMITYFCAYGNENYHDTVTKAIPGFFRYYDARFAPQENIITMDYPTICPVTNCSGIDAIAQYVEYISYEQNFMGMLPQEYVYEVLHRFQPGYRKQFYNICSIILRHILCHMIIEKNIGDVPLQEDYELLEDVILKYDSKRLEEIFLKLLEKLIEERYSEDKLLKSYLQADLKDFTTEVCIAAQNSNIQRVIVL